MHVMSELITAKETEITLGYIQFVETAYIRNL